MEEQEPMMASDGLITELLLALALEINPSDLGGYGQTYENDTFIMRAYDDNKDATNFEMKKIFTFGVFWYKYIGRSMNCDDIEVTKALEMFKMCINSVRRDKKNKEKLVHIIKKGC